MMPVETKQMRSVNDIHTKCMSLSYVCKIAGIVAYYSVNMLFLLLDTPSELSYFTTQFVVSTVNIHQWIGFCQF